MKVSIILSTRTSKSGKNTLALTPEGEFVLRGEVSKTPVPCSLVEAERTDIEGNRFVRTEAIPLSNEIPNTDAFLAMKAWKALEEGI